MPVSAVQLILKVLSPPDLPTSMCSVFAISQSEPGVKLRGYDAVASGPLSPRPWLWL
eukprot:m.51845 g.51845  ORF g.51845 m.51845 type:complete len:57 (+) comp16470_c0_seq1:1116-1286(+)